MKSIKRRRLAEAAAMLAVVPLVAAASGKTDRYDLKQAFMAPFHCPFVSHLLKATTTDITPTPTEIDRAFSNIARIYNFNHRL